MVKDIMVQRSQPGHDSGQADEKVLAIVRALVQELRSKRQPPRVALDSRLDRDLGIDSLGRTELLLRLERGFGVRLPEKLLGEAETPADLLKAIKQAPGAAPTPEAGPEVPTAPELPMLTQTPHDAETLVDVLEWHVEHHADRPHVTVLKNEAEIEAVIRYGALKTQARQVANGLRELGVEHGDRVALMMTTGPDFFPAFFGCLYAGAVAVTVYPPVRMSQLEEHMRRQAKNLANAGCEVLIVSGETASASRLLSRQLEKLKHVKTVASLSRPGDSGVTQHLQGGDLAFIQYTSGSTGDPKGVMLSHDNLLANIRAMKEALAVKSRDVFVSWLPLYHDMGLIGAWMGSLYCGFPLYIMSPLTFLMRPQSWLQAIHRYRGTMTAAPNFALEFCLSKLRDEDLAGLDLSSLRLLANGAEPISPQTLRRFTERFADCGFQPEAMLPVYGLAENCVGLAFPPLARGAVIERIDRDAFMRHGIAEPVGKKTESALEMVNCGSAIPRHRLRVVDRHCREVAERHEGHIQFRGPSATLGYFNNPDKTAALFDGEWVNTGDLGYMAAGELYISGRIKDIIIRSGRNVYPQELEDAVGNLNGVRKGCVVVFGSTTPDSGTEKIVVLAETREQNPARRENLERRISEVAYEVLGTPPDDVILAPPRSVPKTSSGKLRRSAAREIYERNEIGKASRAVWLQLLRLQLSGAGMRLRLRRRQLGESVYALRWWLAAGVGASLGWLLVMLTPRRLHLLRRAGMDLILRLAGIPLQVEGLNNLPPRGAVLVCNHASYIDGLVLTALLPGEPAFVAKKELASHWYAGPLLRRFGTLFVARAQPDQGVKDLKKVQEAAGKRRLVVFFPEGTFRAEPGLLGFHLGAFMTAAEVRLPVVPVVLRGTRSILRADQWFPRRGKVVVSIGPAIEPSQSGFDEALRMSHAAREWMLEHCGEPDAGNDVADA